MARSTSGSTPAVVALARARVSHTVHAYLHDPAAVSDGLGYGQEAAAALGVDAARVLKTLVTSVDGALVVGVVPVLCTLDLKAVAATVGGKRAVMADPQVAQRTTGYVVGGISPLGQRRPLPTVLDRSAMVHESVFVSAGRRGLEVEVAPVDLVQLTGATIADIAVSGPGGR